MKVTMAAAAASASTEPIEPNSTVIALNIPDIFRFVKNHRERQLYERVYSVLLITDKLTVFQNTGQNDLSQFVNLLTAHLPGLSATTYSRADLEDGLRGVYNALTRGSTWFYQNYCLTGAVGEEEDLFARVVSRRSLEEDRFGDD